MKRFLNGESIHAIVVDFQARSVTTSTGRPFSTSRLREIFRNPRYAGLRAYKGEIVAEATWPALIKREHWERMQAILTTRSGDRIRAHVRSRFSPASCVAGNAEVRSRLARTEDNGAYGCQPRAQGGCGSTVIKAEPLEEQIRDWLFDYLDDPVVDEHLAREPETGGSVQKIVELEERADALASMFASGSISRRQFETASQKINADLEAERVHLRPPSVTVTALDAGETVRDLWENADNELRREVLGAVVDHVTIGDAVRGWNFHDPTRAAVAPRI